MGWKDRTGSSTQVQHGHKNEAEASGTKGSWPVVDPWCFAGTETRPFGTLKQHSRERTTRRAGEIKDFLCS